MAVTLLFVIGRAGSKHHVITDAQGVPLALRVTAANVHDSRLVDELIDAVPPVRQGRGRPRQRPAKLHADKAYDLPRCHQDLHKRRIGDRIARRGIESSQRLGRYRWVVERTQAGLAAARRSVALEAVRRNSPTMISRPPRRCWPIPISPSLKSRSALVSLRRRSIGIFLPHEPRIPRVFDNGRPTPKTGRSRRVFLPAAGGGNAPKADSGRGAFLSLSDGKSHEIHVQ